MTGHDLAVRHMDVVSPIPSNDEIDRAYRMGKALAMSGMFKDARQAEQAFAKIMLGRDLGLSPTQAMTNLHIIEGKPELSANLQATMVRQTPGYDFKVLVLTADECSIDFLRDGESLGVSTFSMKDARDAGLTGRGPWKSYPRNMLYARAMSNGVAWFCPEVTGGLRVYAEGEIGGQEQAPALPAAAVPVAEVPQIEAPVADVEIVEVTLVERARAIVASKIVKPGTFVTQLVALGATNANSVETAVLSCPDGNGLEHLLADYEQAIEERDDADEARAEVA